jgi:N-acetylmuramoyl-L-alanine amidase
LLPHVQLTAATPFMPDSSVVAEVCPSPNFGERRNGALPDLLLLHYTGMPDTAAALRRLCTAGTEVSAHYVVLEDGRIIQCVRETHRAWHAGESSWGGDTDVNSRSIGIEIANSGHDWGYPDFPRRQIAALIALCRGIMIRRNIPAHRVIGHSDVAPGRKQDPGEKLPWDLLAMSGVGIWTHPAPLTEGETLALGARGDAVTTLQRTLAAFGYGLTMTGEYDIPTRDVVTAFQRHYRPERIDGLADVSTRATLHNLIAACAQELKAAS